LLTHTQRLTNDQYRLERYDNYTRFYDISILKSSKLGRSIMPESLIGKQLDNYTIEQLLGRGGMSEVYLGRDVNLNRKVAIKIVDSRHRGDPAYAERFVREAQSIANLNHEHIIKIFHFSTSDTLSFFAMEYIEGRDLASVITTYKYREMLMPYQEILHVIQQLAKALDYAHEQGVVHRDIKPSNVMIEDSTQRIVLMDFGLVLEMGRGTLGKVFGSAQYIAPEQAMNSANSVPQSDLYAVGVMIFEMLTGELPFTASSAALMAMKHVNELPPSPRKLNPNLPPEIDTFFDRILAKDPTQRFQTAMVMYEHLARVLEIATTSHGEMSRLTLPGRLNPLGHMATEDEFVPPKAPPSIPSPVAAQPLYDQETYQGGVPAPPGAPEYTNPAPPRDPSYAHFEPKKGGRTGMISLGIVLVIIALLILVGVGVLVLGGDKDDNDNTAQSDSGDTSTQTSVAATATGSIPTIVVIDPTQVDISPESTVADNPPETPNQSVDVFATRVTLTPREDRAEIGATEPDTQTPTPTLTFTLVPPTTLPPTNTASPTDTITPSPIPTETHTLMPTIPTATPTEVVAILTPSPLTPTILYPNGHQIRLLYDENSFYLWNPSQPQLRVIPFMFEPLDSSGLPTERRFEGLAWTQFYGFVEAHACVSMEITQSSPWLRPRQCRYHNALLLPPRNSELVFWIQHGDAVEFRVMWDGEEIGRCPMANSEQQCDVFIPQ
jgi:serine/threonine-protein kinase